MLSLPDLDPGQEIVADNIRVLGTIYFASQLEEMRFFQVAERLVQLFDEGLLPLARRGRGQRLLRTMAKADERLSTHERRLLYARAVDARSSGQSLVGGPRDFHFDWLRFVASVALFEARHDCARVQRAAIALAASASTRGAGLREAAHQLAVDANRLRAILDAPYIQQALGARDMWQVIEQVSDAELGGAVNVARYRTLAVASSSVLQWLADHAGALNNASTLAADLAAADSALIAAVDQWLASAGFGTPELAAVSDQLIRRLGLGASGGRRERPSKVVALFCGPAGTGKSLAAHAVAEHLARDLVRVDLRQVVSKFIGETEKNLEAVFNEVEHTGAVLLLDEADALFGKRTTVGDAHDRFARREIGALVQRLNASSAFVVFESHELPAPTSLQEMVGLSPVIRFPLRPPRSR